MAKVTYTDPVVQTANEARITNIQFIREGVDSEYIHISGEAVVGYFDGVDFTEQDHVHFGERVLLSTAVTFFGSTVIGGSVLATIEQKVLTWMQNTGKLPPGTVS